MANPATSPGTSLPPASPTWEEPEWKPPPLLHTMTADAAIALNHGQDPTAFQNSIYSTPTVDIAGDTEFVGPNSRRTSFLQKSKNAMTKKNMKKAAGWTALGVVELGGLALGTDPIRNINAWRNNAEQRKARKLREQTRALKAEEKQQQQIAQAGAQQPGAGPIAAAAAPARTSISGAASSTGIARKPVGSGLSASARQTEALKQQNALLQQQLELMKLQALQHAQNPMAFQMQHPQMIPGHPMSGMMPNYMQFSAIPNPYQHGFSAIPQTPANVQALPLQITPALQPISDAGVSPPPTQPTQIQTQIAQETPPQQQQEPQQQAPPQSPPLIQSGPTPQQPPQSSPQQAPQQPVPQQLPLNIQFQIPNHAQQPSTSPPQAVPQPAPQPPLNQPTYPGVSPNADPSVFNPQVSASPQAQMPAQQYHSQQMTLQSQMQQIQYQMQMQHQQQQQQQAMYQNAFPQTFMGRPQYNFGGGGNGLADMISSLTLANAMQPGTGMGGMGMDNSMVYADPSGGNTMDFAPAPATPTASPPPSPGLSAASPSIETPSSDPTTPGTLNYAPLDLSGGAASPPSPDLSMASTTDNNAYMMNTAVYQPLDLSDDDGDYDSLDDDDDANLSC